MKGEDSRIFRDGVIGLLWWRGFQLLDIDVQFVMQHLQFFNQRIVICLTNERSFKDLAAQFFVSRREPRL
jgi:hypothetical protein